jgi:putative heme-binding domain-containing protein
MLSHLAKAPVTKDKSGTLPTGEDTFTWNSIIGRGAECRVQLTGPNTASSHFEWLARTDIHMTEACEIQLSTDSSISMRLWLNGELLMPSGGKQPWATGSKRFDSNLRKGSNRILVEVLAAGSKGAQFMVNFRRKSSNPRLEQFTVAALSLVGNADRGRSLFFNTQKGQCIKCHRIDHEGGQVGPELTGVESRLSTARLIESILDPSRTVAPNYRAVTIELKSGRILAGIQVSETAAAVTIKNDQAEELVLSKSEISLIQIQPTSLMPAGLEKSITQEEFVDLIAYLKQLTTPASTSGAANN